MECKSGMQHISRPEHTNQRCAGLVMCEGVSAGRVKGWHQLGLDSSVMFLDTCSGTVSQVIRSGVVTMLKVPLNCESEKSQLVSCWGY